MKLNIDEAICMTQDGGTELNGVSRGKTKSVDLTSEWLF